MAEDCCTVTETFAGIPLGDCGMPAVIVISYRCPAGHTGDTPMCARHRDQFQPDESGDDPAAMGCADCLAADVSRIEYMDITAVHAPVQGPMPGQGALLGGAS